MKQLSQPEINIEEPTSYFSKHLEENERILFSGAFGIGKTFFLKHFFEEKQKEKYNVFHLFPVNYQIANNEDIFELIKYDILFHLFGQDWVDINVETFPKSLVAQTFLLNNGVKILSKIMQCVQYKNIDKVGKAIEILISAEKDFRKYEKDINKNEVTLLEVFHEQLKQKKGSIYEFDAVSEFIYNNLANCNGEIKDVKKHKENVLIIDDLDRIDPEHIFRMLNVFSAHTDIVDTEKGTNKFGFDKIIFVCDINNIRNIFAAKYGANTDFTGYIDKFFSKEIFPFDNKKAIFDFIRTTMYNKENESRYNQNSYTAFEINCLTDILYLFVEGKVINLRKIFANVKDLKPKKLKRNRLHYNCLGYYIIQACLTILGGQKEVLIDAFNKAKLPIDSTFKDIDKSQIISCILPLLIDAFYNNKINIDTTIITNGISFKIRRYSDNYVIAEDFDPNWISYEKFQTLLIEAVNKLDKHGYIN